MRKYIILEEHMWEMYLEREILNEVLATGSTGCVPVYDDYDKAVEAASNPDNVVMLNVED